MLIQEHWIVKEELHSWQTLAHLKGWQGVWEPAKATNKQQDGITGQSGGVAILTWNGILMLKNTFGSDYRAVGTSIGWGRKETLHIFSIYGFDLEQKDQQGQ
eukprot:13933260-Heterocapsa_arctica.AAC.1